MWNIYWIIPMILSSIALALMPVYPVISQGKAKVLDFSGRGRPGRQTSGENRGNCPQTQINLTALMPSSNSGKTVKARPTFWVYVPYGSQDVVKGEFSLQHEDRSDLYRGSFTLPQQPGFVRVVLPESVPPLQKNQSYRWYFKVYCLSKTLSPNQQLPSPNFVQGWVERVEPLPHASSYQAYAENGIWYDAIAELGDLRLKTPTNPELAADWRSLLEAQGVNLKQLANPALEDFSGTVEPQDN
jgi:hypothetical protein